MPSFRIYIAACMLIAADLYGQATLRAAVPKSKEATRASDLDDGARKDLVPAPMPDWFKFQTNDTVNGWINHLDATAITDHAWELWGAITTLTDQQHNGDKLPVYETWWSVQEALAPPGAVRKALLEKRNLLQLETPKQFGRMQEAFRAARPPSSLFSSVKYNDSIKKLIDQRKYNDGQELARINNGWGTTKPIIDRKLQDFDGIRSTSESFTLVGARLELDAR